MHHRQSTKRLQNKQANKQAKNLKTKKKGEKTLPFLCQVDTNSLHMFSR